VEADPRDVGSGQLNSTGSGESRGLRGGGGVKDDGVEPFPLMRTNDRISVDFEK
jgi:hypothetical protein